MRLAPTLIAVLTAATLAAQNDGWAPPRHAKRPGNNGFSTPGNNTKARSQNLYVNADLPPGVTTRLLNKIAYRGSQYPSLIDAAYNARSLPAVSVGIGNTTSATMTTTFASNLPGDLTVVMPTAMVSFPAAPPVGHNAESRAETMIFPFTTPKLITGPNLFIEFLFTDATNVVATYWSDSLDNRTTILNGHNAHRGQGGCGVLGPGVATRLRAPAAASANGLGTTTTYTLSNATASAPYLLSVGIQLDRPYGMPAPVDLAFIGAPGCMLWNSGDITVGGTTTAAGGASLPVPIPNDMGLRGLEVGLQVFVISPGFNPAGVTSSNGIGAFLGGRYPLASSWLIATPDTAPTGTLYAGGAQIVHLYW
jgi:hypothetical protein